ncbi:hypothetical protein RvY_17648-2 [Ramazzottius varieornatus]|uniref:Protein-S-isoprenylcysteine O-methyltransferase n=1 Tax=Ramazzottius varieornatus TaxID=947166 RepID=A0A1D1W2W3_RAMVA|nr:hypothetical protein RvY_17648-1 [Ramazzottius varieornatus]GAV07866.1 hypothetical protein RvY_17648-2 [Ramazzottius varieornatus]
MEKETKKSFSDRWRSESWVCLAAFLAALIVTYGIAFRNGTSNLAAHLFSIALTLLAVTVQNYLSPRRSLAEVAIRSLLLGQVAGLGVAVATSSSSIWMFGAYLVFLAGFHWSEYLSVSIFCPLNLSTSSFMLYHSPAYVVATVASWVEFTIIQYFWPGFRNISAISYLGALFCVVGECLRKAAMATASKSFNHVVEDRKREEHQLVTNGIYGICRHPSYLGWWIFAVGTQIALQNPLCALAYFCGAQRFFAERVAYEEERLVDFFGTRYVEYRRRVPLLLPFIRDAGKEE